MNSLTKRWEILPPDFDLSSKLSKELSVSHITAQILINRGITNAEQAKNFLSPKLTTLSDPLELPQIKEAAKRLFEAKEKKEKVLVYGDYDVDGVTGTALLVSAFRFLGLDTDYYIPHRYEEGYGMNPDAIKEIAERGVKLIVTVDCGISNVEEIALAKKLGIDVIVTDHHNIPSELPAAVAMVNPKFLKEDHPTRYLAGVGVAFKFVWGVFKLAGIKDSAFLMDLLDLVGLGTISDIVPLTQENRVFAVHGLSALNKKKRIGLKYLMEVAGVKNKVSVHAVNFQISPRLNAAGRIKHAELALKLLLTTNANEAKELADKLNTTNLDRRGIGSSIQEEVFDRLTRDIKPEEKIIVLEGKDWHPGVIGIVASQATERYYRPVVIISVQDGVGRGSARSIEGVNVFQILDSCRDMFVDFGGHAGAAGFEIETKKIPELKQKLIEAAGKLVKDSDLAAKIKIEAEIIPKIINLAMVRELESLDPHGEDNPKPIFISRNLKAQDWGRVGANKKHLKGRFSDGSATLDVIGFGMGDAASYINFDEEFDLAYNLQSNEWNGFDNVQLNLVDIRVAKSD
ncbi:MAG: single-stranded-DNA-specific exonuclease RecJ [Candidatus Margulisbacteria bacterium]|nr:single-stranded-DNA-specific exonuclease RecJ [Candidatus Margulisiibacteriota bacterium]MBU1021072.1 single-stranded-DNA-specific exonuclease RecJ [Candidatus Margulisiibacteriota bacterium]MBU1729881.1 single-stranded-DNA-specific exonuclease RecJ [Candidatus Margulisiibacteriota bacterium]MBU1955211.1 single-stranded-DNA-specific exonuclease RecJ [Candidatus Margulisiibacteriota bacterium]